MKPTFAIKRYMNILSVHCNDNYHSSIFKRIKFCLIRQQIYYSYITLLIFFASQTSYSQEVFFQYSGTSIYTVIRNDTIWIGADSKKIRMDNRTIEEKTCKIVVSRNFVFTSAGIDAVSITYQGVTQDINIVYQALSNAIANSNSIPKTIKLFSQFIIPDLKKFTKLSKMNVGHSPGDALLDLVISANFAIVESNIPKVYFLHYFPTITVDDSFYIRTKIDSVIGSPPKNQVEVMVTGKSEAIKHFRKNYTWEIIPNDINKFIGYEIETNPIEVGFPINVIRLDKSGIHWVQKNQPCK